MSESESTEMRYYHRLRRTVRIWAGGEKSKGNRYADFIMAGPDLFMLLVRLRRDSRVSPAHKTMLDGAVVYFISPIDLIPELFLGPVGLVDDVAMAALVLHQVLENTDPAVVRDHWEGSPDILDLIRRILAAGDVMVGGPVWRRLIARVQGFSGS